MGRYLAAYDISCNRKRYRVVKCMLGYGERVQKSVFECTLPEWRYREWMAALQNLALDPRDSIRVYELDGSAQRLVRVFGARPAEREWVI